MSDLSISLLPLHPASVMLFRHQLGARLRRIYRGLRTPKRLILSTLAILLAVAWLGQTAMAVFLREPSGNAQLQLWIPLAMLGYALWDVVKTTFRKRVEPLEWTAAEKELLIAAPLTRRQLVMHRLASGFGSTVLKAACFAVVMTPDLPVWPAGFLGMMLALVFMDQCRMAWEVIVYGLSPRELLRLRLAVLLVLFTAAASALTTTLCGPTLDSTVPASLGTLFGFLQNMAEFRSTWFGVLLSMPFHLFSQVILAEGVDSGLVVRLVVAVLLVAATGNLLFGLERYFAERRNQAEQAEFPGSVATARPTSPRSGGGARSVFIPFRWHGVGALAWRQLMGAWNYRLSILLSLVAPGFLCCLPLLDGQSGNVTLLMVVGSLVFYSFVLLPAALKLDFRRDVDRLFVLKTLPVNPLATTLGELAAPVFICCVFQCLVLLITYLVRPCHPGLLLASWLLLLPVNILVFSLENLIFLLYPYRLHHEGMDVFLRSILVFTAKGLLFAGALAMVLVWLLVSQELGRLTGGSEAWVTKFVFAGGIWLFICTLAAVATGCLATAFDRFDTSQDAPA